MCLTGVMLPTWFKKISSEPISSVKCGTPRLYNFSLYCYLLLLCKNGTFHNFGIWLQLQYSSTETLEVDLFSALQSRSVSLWNTQTWKSMYTEMWCQISASSYWPLTGVHGSWLHWFGSLPSCWGNRQKSPKISHCRPSISSFPSSFVNFLHGLLRHIKWTPQSGSIIHHTFMFSADDKWTKLHSKLWEHI